MNKLNKSLMFTDIHFGRRNNSVEHNQDCLDFINWVISLIKKDKKIDHIIFLGDFFQTRSAIDISTITYAQEACRLLNDINIPIYVIIGNHDLYHKHTRDIHSPIMFSEFSNFIIIDEPQIRPEIGDNSFLSPYLFKHEYKELKDLKKAKIVFGHFEFNGFYVTGYYKVSHENGPEPGDFTGPKHIFSGHFHKRQIGGNIIYIGNTFGFDYSDVDDTEKGCCTYDHTTEKYKFTNWADSPLFTRIKLSELLDKMDKKEKNIFKDRTSVTCTIDVPLTYEQHIGLKKIIKETYKLRDFNLKELPDTAESVTDTEVDLDIDLNADDAPVLNNLVVQMLDKIDTPNIDNEMLKKIYKGLT